MLAPQLGSRARRPYADLLAYIGATPEKLAEFDNCQRRSGQGTIQITLQPCRRNLLRIDYQRL
jgi:hypothetical protein